MTETPISLLERLRQPFSADAWAHFVALYTPLIYSWGRGVGLQDQDAGDLVQDVFVTLVEVLPIFGYDPQKSFRRWLRTVTVNKWRERCKQREARAGLDHHPEPAVPDDVAAFWEAEYREHVVGQAMGIVRSDFQPNTWNACWEHVVQGRPAPQVAAELGMTVGAVYAAKVRVLRRLRQELRELLD